MNLTEEQQKAIEATYEFHAKEGIIIRETNSRNAYLTGAKEIIDNPIIYGLVPLQKLEDMVMDGTQRGAKEIIDNPAKYGLKRIEDSDGYLPIEEGNNLGA